MKHPIGIRTLVPGKVTRRANTAVFVVKADRNTAPLGLASG
jgi:hypothetical protein